MGVFGHDALLSRRRRAVQLAGRPPRAHDAPGVDGRRPHARAALAVGGAPRAPTTSHTDCHTRRGGAHGAPCFAHSSPGVAHSRAGVVLEGMPEGWRPLEPVVRLDHGYVARPRRSLSWILGAGSGA